ncbi:ABC transporter substrate-binding protein [Microbacterium pseudoresistens]|uniref:Iron complex transport system substrate-binding protein n=1 Tax=Microbacterium pseudoresistens TaxID=640634 RepID=A0A7Y9EV54_9MICO|nr:putative F420-0 ABC transporter substrate-binding protein [Microbacterium pseudoresistens]NYD54394.1 iron complex transport system substrate-binding protein [Microbacterium pseudoresistens]
MRHRLLRSFGIVALVGAAFAVTACTADATASEPASEPPATAGYPLTVDNCGTAVTFDRAPERVLAIKSTSTEMMLALGLQDRLIGTAFSDGPVSEEWADRADGIPVIDEKVPGQEAVLDLEPDLVYAGWESNVTAEGAGDRGTLASLGVNTYVSPAACQEPGYQPESLTFDDVLAEIDQAGTIFDASDAATELIDDLRARLDALTPDNRGLSALWFSSGSDTPFVGGGIGAPQMIMDAAGLTNIAADIDETWSSMSWETVVDTNPDVIVLVDSAWGSTEKKIGVLEANPATAQLPAVVNRRYLIVPFATTEAGVRNVEAVETLLAQLAEVPSP